MNKKQPINSNQLSFSIGRPLASLLEEVQSSSNDTSLRKAAEQMLKALHTFEVANQAGVATSRKTNQNLRNSD